MPPPILFTFLASLAGFTFLFFWLFKLETRIRELSDEPEEESG
jgi:hypothetical protein